MEWRFNSERLWVWWLNLAVYVGLITTYFVVDGHEMIYSMYLPLDFLLNCAKAAYYFYHFFLEQQKQAKEEQRRQIFLKKQLMKNVAQGLSAMLSGGPKPADENTGSVENSDTVEQEKTLYGDEIKLQKKKHKLLKSTL